MYRRDSVRIPFSPQILALTGCPRNRPALVDLAYSITKRQSLFICAQVLQVSIPKIWESKVEKWITVTIKFTIRKLQVTPKGDHYDRDDICRSVVCQGTMKDHVHRLRSTTIYRWFRHRHVSAFYTSVAAPTVRQGMEVLMQVSSLPSSSMFCCNYVITNTNTHHALYFNYTNKKYVYLPTLFEAYPENTRVYVI